MATLTPAEPIPPGFFVSGAQASHQKIARLKLAAIKVGIVSLTEEERRYLASWKMGT